MCPELALDWQQDRGGWMLKTPSASSIWMSDREINDPYRSWLKPYPMSTTRPVYIRHGRRSMSTTSPWTALALASVGWARETKRRAKDELTTGTSSEPSSKNRRREQTCSAASGLVKFFV